MRVLVTWGSKRGGTEGIAHIVGDALESAGFEVVTAPAEKVRRVDEYDAAVVGGALYANRWPSSVRRFARRHTEDLRRIPVWFFSSGPLDDSAERKEIPAPNEVATLAESVGAKDHATFGGRLEADAKGFPASAMAKEMSGDWRSPERIRAWADGVAGQLPHAEPGTAVDHPGASAARLVGYAVAGWGFWAGIGAGLQTLLGGTAALVLHAVATPLLFGSLAWQYFRARGARDPLPVALTWTALLVGLGFVLRLGILREPAAPGSVLRTWIPFALAFLATYATGSAMATLPWRDPDAGRG